MILKLSFALAILGSTIAISAEKDLKVYPIISQYAYSPDIGIPGNKYENIELYNGVLPQENSPNAAKSHPRVSVFKVQKVIEMEADRTILTGTKPDGGSFLVTLNPEATSLEVKPVGTVVKTYCGKSETEEFCLANVQGSKGQALKVVTISKLK